MVEPAADFVSHRRVKPMRCVKWIAPDVKQTQSRSANFGGDLRFGASPAALELVL